MRLKLEVYGKQQGESYKDFLSTLTKLGIGGSERRAIVEEYEKSIRDTSIAVLDMVDCTNGGKDEVVKRYKDLVYFSKK